MLLVVSGSAYLASESGQDQIFAQTWYLRLGLSTDTEPETYAYLLDGIRFISCWKFTTLGT